MSLDTKILIGASVATLIILVGAVFIFGNQKPGTSGPKVDSTLLIRSDSYRISSASARISLVEFSDYQCPACASYYSMVKQVIAVYTGKLNFVYRNFPLTQHRNARLSAQAAIAAGKQNKFWEMHDMLFTSQDKWAEQDNARDIFTGYAKDLGLNTDTFKKDLDAKDIADTIDQDLKDGTVLGIDSTPTFYLDGVKLDNPGSSADFKSLIDAALKRAQITPSPSPAGITPSPEVGK
jgi:protein-disulfide isomerase